MQDQTENISANIGEISWQRDAGIALFFLVALLLWDSSAADMAVIRWFGTTSGFAWRDHWLTAGVLHQGGRWLSTVALLALIVNVVRPQRFGSWRMSRRAALWCLATTGLCLLLIPALKQLSTTSCPWDLAEFGGRAQHLSHWAFGRPDGGPGRCFPAGHASGAFSFFAAWFVLRQPAPRAAKGWLLGVCLVGALFGIAQLVRGAHYPSHTFWTAWICWSTSALLWHGAQAAARAQRRSAALTAPARGLPAA